MIKKRKFIKKEESKIEIQLKLTKLIIIFIVNQDRKNIKDLPPLNHILQSLTKIQKICLIF